MAEFIKVLVVAVIAASCIAFGHHCGRIQERAKWIAWYCSRFPKEERGTVFIPGADWIGKGDGYEGGAF